VQLHFIKDSWSVKGGEGGMLGSFFFAFISEANAVARAQVSALGGNALLCHRLVPQESGGRVARNNQAYNMLSITGDAVLVEFPPDFDHNNTTLRAADALADNLSALPLI
jgi:hypothetical protein